MSNSYDQDNNNVEMDKKIKTLEKHVEYAEKEATIVELEYKKKKLEEEWALKKICNGGLYSEQSLYTFLREQEVRLRTAKQEIQRITDHRREIIESNYYYQKELKAEKEKLEQETSKLSKQIQQKDKQIQQKVATLKEAFRHYGNCISELEQKGKKISELNDLITEKDEQKETLAQVVSNLNELVAEKNKQLSQT